MPKRTDYVSPWRLTPSEARAMDAVIKHGCQKLAAAELGVGGKTIEAHCCRAAAKMGASGFMLRKYLQWDRWRRSAA